MKKLLVLLLSFIMIITMMPVLSFAGSVNNDDLIQVSKNVVHKGESFDVTIKTPVVATSADSFGFKVNFDKNSFKVTDAEFFNDTYTHTGITDANNNGTIGITGASDNPIYNLSNLTIMKVTFEVLSNASLQEKIFSFEYEMSEGDDSFFVINNFEKAIKVVENITDGNISIAAPIKGAKLATLGDLSVTDSSKYSVTAIEWHKGSRTGDIASGNALASTKYYAKLSLQSKDGYVFGTDFNPTVSNGTKTVDSITKDSTTCTVWVEFDATLAKSLTKIEITSQPTNKSYTHGDQVDKTGLVVKASYDDSSTDTAYTGYTITYKDGAAYLKKGVTEAYVNVSGVSPATITNLTVGAKELSISGLSATNREYDGTTLVKLTGGALTGVVGQEVVNAAVPTFGNITNANKGDNLTVNIMTPSLTGTDAGNYTLQNITGIKVNISAKNISDAAVALDNASLEYSGSSQTVNVTAVTVGNVKLSSTTDYEVSGNTQTDVNNSYTVTVTGKGNYTGTKTATWKITPATLTLPDAVAMNKVYDGTNAAVISSGNLSGVLNSDAVSLVSNTIVGTFAQASVGNSVTVSTTNEFALTGAKAGNYTLTQPTGFTANITKYSTAKLTNSMVLSQNIVVEKGEFDEPSFDGVGTEKATGELKYSVGGTSNLNYSQVVDILKVKANYPKETKGTIGWTFTANGNYGFTTSGNISFEIVDIIFKVGNDAANSSNAVTIKTNPTYGDKWQDIVTIKSSSIAASVDGTPVSGTYSLSVTPTDIPDAGSNEFAVLFNGGSYQNVVVFSGTVTIAQKKVTVPTIIRDVFEYAKTLFTVSFNSFDSALMTTSGDIGKTEAGSYTAKVVLKDKGNYMWTDTSDTTDKAYAWSITKKTIGLKWRVNEFVYNGTEQVPIAEATGLLEGDACTVTVSGAQKAASEGSYVAEATDLGNENYQLPAAVTKEFKITKRPINITGVKATSNSGTSVTLAGGQLAGVVSGDDVSFNLGTGTIDKTTEGVHSVSTSITLTGKDAANYQLAQPTVNYVILPENAAEPEMKNVQVKAPTSPSSYETAAAVALQGSGNGIKEGETALTDKALESLGDTSTVNSLLSQISGLFTTPSDVKISAEPYMDIELKSCTAESMEVEIIPMVQFVATDGNIQQNVGAPSELKITEPVEIVIAIPAELAAMAVGGKLFIKHKDIYEYEGTVSGSGPYYLTFTSLHGFSPFVISAVSSKVARIEGTGAEYLTLQAAVDDVGNNDTITILKATSLTAQVSREVKFYVASEANLLTSKAITAGSGYSKANDTYTFTKDQQGGGTVVVGGGGGGGAPAVKQYTITFSSNGGTGVMSSVKAKANDSYLLPECTFKAPEGKEFKCWLINGDEYNANTYFLLTGNVTVKAVWQDIPKQEEPKVEEPVTQDNSKLIAGIKATTIKASSQLVKSVNGKNAVKLTWTKSKGYKVDYYIVYRSTSKNSGYKAIYTTANGNKTSYTNSKNLKKGTKYYYKVVGIREIDGVAYKTKYSTKASRTIK